MINEKINCYKCQYYYITWDAAFPKGCKFYGFKSMNLPSILVKQSSGLSCIKFTPKQNRAPN
ncbi:uracil-DNA glycosylase [Clostridium bowmanii]|uniref:uracil-DNA glycosylase n=1 Tax=Clostridium bowmanii TaxID=132925 RepID=UPI001C0BAB52|nr:uracil-DNA glycosylase [Clostridium bowmanii]MBU3190096.1 uracil-DNA glycosylase [Clostridium bowmanii]MCA1074691.1 uracil-DNA glycosylase [Clostridium bowmanii]